MRVRSLATVGAALVAASCSSSATHGTVTLADASGMDAGESCPSNVSFSDDVLPIFAESCSTGTVCHGQMGNSGEENLYLGLNPGEGTNSPSQVAMVYAGLVGVKSLEDPSMNLVTASELQDSYLWHKIAGDQNTDTAVANGCQTALAGPNVCSDCIAVAPCGVQMPFSGVLEPSAVCTIQNWIAGGAQNN